jgi:hypothetical protein
MDKELPGRDGPRSVTCNELKRIVLTVASAVLNPGMSRLFTLLPSSPAAPWPVRVTFDVERFADRIKNSRVTNHEQVTSELERLSKFYTPEDGGVHEEPMVVVDCHGRILLWYLPEVLSQASLVRANSP